MTRPPPASETERLKRATASGSAAAGRPNAEAQTSFDAKQASPDAPAATDDDDSCEDSNRRA